ncbi:MAG: BatD family protein [Pseudomonadales bacterium]|nr:BatD family protein [Pseudomonadales bacterium]
MVRQATIVSFKDAVKLCTVWLIFFTLFGSLSAQSDTLSVRVDKNKIYETDTLTLQIEGEVELDLSLGGLLSLGRSDFPAPDTTPLLSQFEILSQNQQYNMRHINGETKAQITWQYTLAPKQTGKLTIPALTLKDDSSEPIAIEVLPGQSKPGDGTPSLAFFETEIDKQTVYLQEQVIFTVRFFHTGNARGDLSQPEHKDIIIELLDENRYNTMRYNINYEVIERKYVLFPQVTGTIIVPKIEFSGQVRNLRRRMEYKRAYSTDQTISVKPIPDTFTGTHWLPLRSLTLKESWDKDPAEITVGDALNRSISLQAIAALGSALPNIPADNNKNLKLYPAPLEKNSTPNPLGAEATAEQNIAVIAVEPGTITLPAIRIPWWDTAQDIEQVAEIPARTIHILPDGTQPVPAPAVPVAIQENVGNDPEKTPQPPTINANGETVIWQWLSFGLAALWLLTVIAMILIIRNRQNTVPAPTKSVGHNPEWKHVFAAFSAGEKNAISLLIRQLHHEKTGGAAATGDLRGQPLINLEWVKRYFDSPELTRLLDAYERELYGVNSTRSIDSQIRLGTDINAVMKRCLKNVSSRTPKTKHSDLPDLYPY